MRLRIPEAPVGGGGRGWRSPRRPRLRADRVRAGTRRRAAVRDLLALAQDLGGPPTTRMRQQFRRLYTCFPPADATADRSPGRRRRGFPRSGRHRSGSLRLRSPGTDRRVRRRPAGLRTVADPGLRGLFEWGRHTCWGRRESAGRRHRPDPAQHHRRRVLDLPPSHASTWESPSPNSVADDAARSPDMRVDTASQDSDRQEMVDELRATVRSVCASLGGTAGARRAIDAGTPGADAKAWHVLSEQVGACRSRDYPEQHHRNRRATRNDGGE